MTKLNESHPLLIAQLEASIEELCESVDKFENALREANKRLSRVRDVCDAPGFVCRRDVRNAIAPSVGYVLDKFTEVVGDERQPRKS